MFRIFKEAAAQLRVVREFYFDEQVSEFEPAQCSKQLATAVVCSTHPRLVSGKLWCPACFVSNRSQRIKYLGSILSRYRLQKKKSSPGGCVVPAAAAAAPSPLCWDAGPGPGAAVWQLRRVLGCSLRGWGCAEGSERGVWH